MSNKLFSAKSCVCLDFKAFCSCLRIIFLNQLRKPGPVVFGVGRGGSKSEELLGVHSTCVGTFCHWGSTGCALCLVRFQIGWKKLSIFPHFEDALCNFPLIFTIYFDPSPFKVLVLWADVFSSLEIVYLIGKIKCKYFHCLGGSFIK